MKKKLMPEVVDSKLEFVALVGLGALRWDHYSGVQEEDIELRFHR